MSVSRRVIHHGLYFAVLGPLIGVLFLVLYIFFAKEPLVLLRRIQVLPLFLLLSITTGVIPALLTGVMVACLPEKSKRLVRTVLIFTESSDQLSRATDRVPGLPASPGYVQ